jgi:ribosomal protein L15
VTLFQTLQHLRVRIPERVLKARGDHAKRRPHGIQERDAGRGPAAVVRHFQHVAVHQSAVGEQLPLYRAFDIAGQQERVLAVAEAQHQ